MAGPSDLVNLLAIRGRDSYGGPQASSPGDEQERREMIRRKLEAHLAKRAGGGQQAPRENITLPPMEVDISRPQINLPPMEVPLQPQASSPQKPKKKMDPMLLAALLRNGGKR